MWNKLPVTLPPQVESARGLPQGESVIESSAHVPRRPASIFMEVLKNEGINGTAFTCGHNCVTM